MEMYWQEIQKIPAMKNFCLALLMIISAHVSAHPGRTNAEGCHAGKQPYHCHSTNISTQSKSSPLSKKLNEDTYNLAFCSSIGGQTETQHTYQYPGGKSFVKIDCETSDTVYEGGLDKRSSLDSIQQTLFFSHLTGKQPAVVIYNTDGKFGRYEHRIKMAAEMAGVAFFSWQY